VLEPVWDSVLRRAVIHHPFLEYAWARTWWECFRHGSRLNILVVLANEEPIAIAPLILTSSRMWGIRVRRLSFLYSDHVPRADFIVAEGHEEAYAAIWNHLRQAGGWDLLQLCQLSEDSPTQDHLRALAAQDGCRTGIWESSLSPYIELSGGRAAYEQGLASKHKSNLRNRLKRLHHMGPVEIETIETSERAAEALDEGFRLEAAAWKRNAGTAIACDPEIARFYRLFARRAAQAGWLRLNFLRVGASRIAFDYSLVYQDRVFLLKIGYDPAFSQYSPSNLLLSLALQRAFDNNFTEYDFLGDQADWKRCWAKDVRRHVWLYIFPGTRKSRLLYLLKFGLVPLIRSIMRRKRGAAA
jgi:CelD/BcsL family acetyltransferase involved in cellulose biosynthesis